MKTPLPLFYSAAQLARAAGVPKRQLLADLRDTTAPGTLIVQGNEIGGWSVEALPEKHRQEIKRRAIVLTSGSADVHDFISRAAVPYDPPIPLEQIAPSTREKESLWIGAFKLLKARAADAAEQKKTRVRLVKHLWRCAPWLAKSKNALRVAMAAKYATWLESKNQESDADGREAKKGIPTAPPIEQGLIDDIVSASIWRTGGRVSQAVREVRGMAGELDIADDLAEMLLPGEFGKSYVNRRLRESVRHEVRAMYHFTQSQRVQDNHRAAVKRKYNFPAGYCVSADDVTLPVYWVLPDGNGWFNLVRGQCIITIDARTLRILGFSLQPDRNYSSPVIHTNFTRVFADFGVPRLLYIERGIWKNSKLITGGPRAQTHHADYEFMPFSWSETERGLGDLGIKIMHAIRARSKVVETVMRLVQIRMEAEPGYCGRDERRDCPAITKRHMEAVKFHHPGSEMQFYNFDQWHARLVEIFSEYNAEKQEGEILDGLSPEEGWQQLQSEDEAKRPMLFDETCRHYLAHYRTVKIPGRDGITITIGRKRWYYSSARLSLDKGKKVLAWFNPDEPSALAVTDMNMKHPYTVPMEGVTN
jgi:hypothetical protein